MHAYTCMLSIYVHMYNMYMHIIHLCICEYSTPFCQASTQFPLRCPNFSSSHPTRCPSTSIPAFPTDPRPCLCRMAYPKLILPQPMNTEISTSRQQHWWCISVTSRRFVKREHRSDPWRKTLGQKLSWLIESSFYSELHTSTAPRSTYTLLTAATSVPGTYTSAADVWQKPEYTCTRWQRFWRDSRSTLRKWLLSPLIIGPLMPFRHETCVSRL